ncbi:hypothetical protein LOK49_LG01G02871 [Camellia lanceoleosa]|uniref:Uncharacterized protein n=1 Tax=Camellia lanceoleosa TaxID=1840588 RepID=A0ACC0J450_9ERIC|nr:hypothetical protein LOK49_LG01G02871 [Camellia lanceoleosa]
MGVALALSSRWLFENLLNIDLAAIPSELITDEWVAALPRFLGARIVVGILRMQSGVLGCVNIFLLLRIEEWVCYVSRSKMFALSVGAVLRVGVLFGGSEVKFFQVSSFAFLAVFEAVGLVHCSRVWGAILCFVPLKYCGSNIIVFLHPDLIWWLITLDLLSTLGMLCCLGPFCCVAAIK